MDGWERLLQSLILSKLHPVFQHLSVETTVHDNQQACYNAIASALNLPLRTVQRHIEQLKKQDKIEFRGAPRNGGYYPKS